MNAKKSLKPQAWQLNPENVKTETVQYWRNGIMLTAQMSRMGAREMIRQKTAFVISDQAIGALINGEMKS